MGNSKSCFSSSVKNKRSDPSYCLKAVNEEFNNIGAENVTDENLGVVKELVCAYEAKSAPCKGADSIAKELPEEQNGKGQFDTKLDANKPVDEGTETEVAQEGNAQVTPAGTFLTTSEDVLSAQLECAGGLPYKVQNLGPPPPPCNDQRMSTVNAISALHPEYFNSLLEPPEDPELTSILKLVSSIFNAPACLVALFGDRRIFIRDATGMFQRGDFPWRYSFCGWTMASQSDQIMVIPDATRDARFANNKFVTSSPGVRFYCGTPLLASNGHRIGTLCFADFKPRVFDASGCMILSNLAEMVVRHVEKDIALQLRTQDNQNLTAAYGQLKRTLDAFDNCVLVIDTRENDWKIAYTNLAWKKLTGVDREAVVNLPLSKVFRGTDGQPLPWDKFTEVARQNKEFTIPKAELLPDLLESGSAGKKVGKKLMLKFRPACSEELDDQALSIGVPAYVPPAAADRREGLYFCSAEDLELVLSRRSSSRDSSGSVVSSSRSKSFWNDPPIKGLDLGHLLGRGSFGSVYFARWFGSPVAVKILESSPSGGGEADPSLLPEVALGQDLRHPHVVAILKCASRTISSVAGSASSSIYPGGSRERTGKGQQQFLLATGGDSVTAQSNTLSFSNLEGIPEQGVVEGEASAASATVSSSVTDSGEQSGACSVTTGQQQPAEGAGWAVINLAKNGEMDTQDDDHFSSSTLTSGCQPFMPMNGFPVSGSNTAGSSVSQAPSGSTGRPAGQVVRTWIIMEYCDKGCLQDAIDRGWLRCSRGDDSGGPEGNRPLAIQHLDPTGQPTLPAPPPQMSAVCCNPNLGCSPVPFLSVPSMSAVLATALEVAGALAFLHSRNIIHGDLSAWNVMLTSSSTTDQGAIGAERGFKAKIADFGLSRMLDVRTRIQTKTYGTLTHMPVELLRDGTMGTFTDIYSFGVLLWQMYTGSRPWGGMTHGQIMMMLVTGKGKLRFPLGTPMVYENLACRCMSQDPADRPAIAEVVATLEQITTLEEMHTEAAADF